MRQPQGDRVEPVTSIAFASPAEAGSVAGCRIMLIVGDRSPAQNCPEFGSFVIAMARVIAGPGRRIFAQF
jgi:hypothetical protein